MDDTVRLLIRFVARGFYGKPYVLVLDAILLHSVLSEDDLSHLLGIQRKELRSLCSKLVEDRLLTLHIQKEEGSQFRPISRTYYYIHYTEAIDSIKWKVHSLVQAIKVDLQSDSNPQGFICPVCKTKYSQLDALALLNYEKNEFLCSLCSEVLIEDDSGKIAKENQIKYSHLMKQLEPLIGYLRKIDEHPIPENNFETSLARVIPVQATSAASYTVSNIGKGGKMFDRNSYLNNRSSIRAGSKAQATLHVNITTSDDTLQREQAALQLEEKRKQNALPTWHEESTIGKALGRLDKEDDNDENDAGVKLEGNENDQVKSENILDLADSNDIKTEAQSTLTSDSTQQKEPVQFGANDEDKEAQDALAEYYAKLAENAKADEDEEDEEDEDEEDEDEDEFDEVNFDDIGSSQVPQEKSAEDMIVEEMDIPDSDEN